MTNPSNNRRLEPHAPEPAALPVPDEPSAEEKQRHLLTHLPYAPWCELCVAGAGRDGQHRRKQMGENGQLETVVQADYTFFARNAQQSLVEDESTLVTVLTFVDKTSAWPLSLQVTKKGDCSQYVLNTVEQYLRNLGHEKTVTQIDQENWIKSVAKAIQKRMGDKRVQIREAPIHSHQSQGAVEGEHAKIAGLVRSILLDLQSKYPACPVDVNHVAFPWLVRHASWLVARFQPRTKDHATSYRVLNGVDYMSPICHFGETVMARLPQPGTKTQRRWVKGIWVGRLERDDTHIILTAAGAMSVRSVRRLPPSSQWQPATLGIVTGLPWQPKWGRRAAIPPPQTSPPFLALPVPQAPQPRTTEERSLPASPAVMAQDGPAERLDFPNLAAEGDAMAELLEAEQASLSLSLPGEAPTDVEPEPTTPASSPETPAPEIPMDSPDDGNGADVPIAVRGAGWNSPMASLPSAPAMPAGLGEGGMSPTSKRMGGPSRVEEQRPAKQVREEPPKKPKIGKLHTEKVWKM